MRLDNIKVLGVDNNVSAVTFDGTDYRDFVYNFLDNVCSLSDILMKLNFLFEIGSCCSRFGYRHVGNKSSYHPMAYIQLRMSNIKAQSSLSIFWLCIYIHAIRMWKRYSSAILHTGFLHLFLYVSIIVSSFLLHSKENSFELHSRYFL